MNLTIHIKEFDELWTINAVQPIEAYVVCSCGAPIGVEYDEQKAKDRASKFHKGTYSLVITGGIYQLLQAHGTMIEAFHSMPDNIKKRLNELLADALKGEEKC